MHLRSLIATTFCLVVIAAMRSRADEPTDADRPLADAARKTAALRGYAFKIEGDGLGGRGVLVEGKHEKGQPAFFIADRIEFGRKGEVLVYKDAGKWQRTKTGIQSDPLRILGASAKVREARLPHEELSDLVKALKGARQGERKVEGFTVYTGTFDEDGARKLTPVGLRSVARSGEAKLWVSGDGDVQKYTFTIRLQGNIGSVEVDGHMKRTVTLTDRGTARVELPDEAKKALE
jgi:hypothetical protein